MGHIDTHIPSTYLGPTNGESQQWNWRIYIFNQMSQVMLIGSHFCGSLTEPNLLERRLPKFNQGPKYRVLLKLWCKYAFLGGIIVWATNAGLCCQTKSMNVGPSSVVCRLVNTFLADSYLCVSLWLCQFC